MRQIMLVALTLLSLAGSVGAAEPVWRWDAEGDLLGWTPGNFQSVTVTGSRLVGLTKYDCQLVSPPLELDAARYRILEFRVSSSVSGGGELFFHGPGEGFTEKRMARHVLFASDEPRVYRVDLSNVEGWQGTITRLRLDLLNHADAQLSLDWVRLLEQDWGAVPNGGFEDDSAGDGRPDGWVAEKGTLTADRQHALAGDRSGKVQAAGGQAILRTRANLDPLGTFRLEGRVTATAGGPAKAVWAELRYRDVFGKLLPEQPVRLAATREGEGWVLAADFEAPRVAASADLRLGAEGAGLTVWWDEVRLNHLRENPAAEARPLESWRADWIWAAETAGQDQVSAYFRHEFTLTQPLARILEARLQITADDTYELYLNGRLLADTQGDLDGWRTPEIIDLKPALVAGRNVLAVRATDRTSAEGLLVEGSIRAADSLLEIMTGAHWKAVGQGPEGWQQPDFAAAGWPAAKVVSPAGGPPWGNLPYVYMGRRETVRLLSKTVPARVTAGDTLTVGATLAALPAAAEGELLRLSLLREGEELLGLPYRPAEVVKTVGGRVQLGPVSVRLTRFMPPGRYEVALGFPRTEYEPGRGVVLGPVQVLAPSRPEPPVQAEIRQHNGIATLFLNGRPSPFHHYLEIDFNPVHIRNMASAGVHVYELATEDYGWVGPDKFDYTAWDRAVLALLTYDPEAVIIPTFTMAGLRQKFWSDAHRDQLACTEDGNTRVGVYVDAGEVLSLASESWREASGEAMRRFIHHCQQAPYAGRIIGYHPNSGVSWEWQHWGSVGAHEPTDYSLPMQQAFQRWTRQRYGGDLNRLRAAWNQPQITFETVRVPSVAQRDGADHFIFRDPSRSGYVVDFYRFNQDVMVDGILHYLQIIKHASKGRALTGTYYGYTVTMLGSPRRAGDSGHYALHRLLTSGMCDLLFSPFDYSQRHLGESYTIMSPIGSVQAHNTVWALQADLRTHLVTDLRQRRHGSPEGLEGTVSQLRRAFANATARGSATQWYDFSHGWIARDPRQAQVIRQLDTIARQWVNWPHRGPDPEGVAVIVDERSPSLYLGHELNIMYWLVYRQKAIFDRLGVPWNIYLLDDVLSGKVPKFKFYCFLNCFHLTADQRATLQKLQGEGRTLAWFTAPGYVGETDLKVNYLKEMTGFTFREEAQRRPWRLTANGNHRLLAGVKDWEQPSTEIGPVFVPEASGEEVLATWAETDWPGLVMRRHAHWTSIYSATPLLSPRLLKALCREAGVLPVTESTEPSFVTRDFIGLHSAVARTEQLRFARPTRVTDLLSGEVLAPRATRLAVPLAGPETRLLRLEPAR
jgi:hypothetical protein